VTNFYFGGDPRCLLSSRLTHAASYVLGSIFLIAGISSPDLSAPPHRTLSETRVSHGAADALGNMAPFVVVLSIMEFILVDSLSLPKTKRLALC